MNDLQYLHEISQSNRPQRGGMAGGLGKILRSKIFRFAVIALGLILVLSLVGGALGSTKNKEREAAIRLNMRLTGVISNIGDFNQYVKSSRLRAMGVSLSSALSETSRDVAAILAANYNYKPGDKGTEELQKEEDEYTEELNATLSRAKLNGILDRTYAYQMAYEIALIMSIEQEVLGRTGDETWDAVLNKSMESLNLLYEQFARYSDASN